LQKLPDSFTVAQVAEMLGVSEKSVRDFINSGEIAAVKVGQWRINRQALEDFMQSRSNFFRSKARKEALAFLAGDDALPADEDRVLVILDYPAPDPKGHCHLVNTLSQTVRRGSRFRWTFYYEEKSRRARHLLQGDLPLVLALAAELDKQVGEMNA
jgi:excisionase family DNA binding protein